MSSFEIRGAEVFPGDAAQVRADVAVDEGRIAAVGRVLGGENVVDGQGLWLCPGFIDMHAHAALRSFTSRCSTRRWRRASPPR